MSVIVTDSGFSQETEPKVFVPLSELPANDCGGLLVDVSSDADPGELEGRLHCIEAIRIDFPSFADGRGMTIASRLRVMGFKGRLRAKGHVLADQYAMVRRTGFDEVEISDELSKRQPEDQWLFRANWQDHNYQSRLRG